MQPERADLYFQQGSSDKVYHLQLRTSRPMVRSSAMGAAWFRLAKRCEGE